jgi:2-polyprenyl-3-methyl-5-hydroxy-6-metoxy-1,4-benzoquinol methylase
VGANNLLNLAPSDFVFYSIFEWQDRKNPAGTIEAFLRAFPEDNEAVLVLKTSPASARAAKATLDELVARTSSRGRVMLRCEAWDEKTMAALHLRGDCYISLHKGEGWGYPLFEAACRGTPVVATAYAGPLEYLDSEHHWLVRCSAAPVRQRYAFYHPGMRWAEPDIAHAAEGLTWVYQNREAAGARARAATPQLCRNFSVEHVGAMAKSRLLALLEQSNPQRLTAIRQQNRSLRPERLPIEGEWFDADYFEHGVKSNWERGYSWPIFRSIFEDTAAYLIQMFPEASSFLDVGCAKGFLVKALRQLGLDAWGFDHSSWAITHAEAAAKPFLKLADIATANYDRTFDLVVAMSILESLTEQQLDHFLPRARTWATQAIIAVIATNNGGAPAAVDRDLAHITMRDRAWWIARFLAAGWRQDALHRAAERQCQTHPLPTRMCWEVFVFSPESQANT